MGKKKDFKWRHQPPFDSDSAKLLDYIQNKNLHPFQDKTTMIMTALGAYYLPLALYSEGSCERKTLELIFLDSVNAIINHLKYLCTVIKLEEGKVSHIFRNAFLEVVTEVDNSQDLASEQILTSAPDAFDETDNFELQMWNLAGITTDSETFQ